MSDKNTSKTMSLDQATDLFRQQITKEIAGLKMKGSSTPKKLERCKYIVCPPEEKLK